MFATCLESGRIKSFPAHVFYGVGMSGIQEEGCRFANLAVLLFFHKAKYIQSDLGLELLKQFGLANDAMYINDKS